MPDAKKARPLSASSEGGIAIERELGERFGVGSIEIRPARFSFIR